MPFEASRPRFYYDFSSPYAYLAAERVRGLFEAAGVVQPEWVPISFGHILKATGRTPWSLQPNGPDRDDLEEIARRAAARGLPRVRYDKGWPTRSYSLLPLRVATYAKQRDKLVEFSLAAFRERFVRGRNLSDIETALSVAADSGRDRDPVRAALDAEPLKRSLRGVTEEAIRLGIEGIPTVTVGPQLFWGDDLLESAVAAAAVEMQSIDPTAPDAQHCIRCYFAELDRRSDSGFDPEAGISAEPYELVRPAGLMLVVYLGSQTVGCGAVKHHNEAPSEIKRMWVTEDMRGLGIGRRLLSELEGDAVGHGARAVRLETNSALREAIALYESAGYVEVRAFNDEPFADHWFEKSLDGARDGRGRDDQRD